MSVVENGMIWHEFSVEFETLEGLFSFSIFALSAEHASYMLEELKETAHVSGQVVK